METLFIQHLGIVNQNMIALEYPFLTHAAHAHLIFHVFSFYSGIEKGVDVVVSSVEAYLSALNKMLDFKE